MHTGGAPLMQFVGVAEIWDHSSDVVDSSKDSVICVIKQGLY